MSREIKFRIWDSEKNEWLAESDDDALTYYGFHLVGEVMTVQAPPQWALDPHCVVEQYTGLKDKNGKEIYEGDVVKAKIQGFWETGTNTITEGKATWNLEVIYNDIRYMDVFHILGSKNQPNRIYYLFEEAISDIEVIGNIHENPELLEGER